MYEPRSSQRLLTLASLNEWFLWWRGVVFSVRYDLSWRFWSTGMWSYLWSYCLHCQLTDSDLHQQGCDSVKAHKELTCEVLGSLSSVAEDSSLLVVTPCWVIGSDVSKDRVAFILKGRQFKNNNSSWTAKPAKMKTFRSFETSTAIHPATHLGNQQHWVPLFVSVSGGEFWYDQLDCGSGTVDRHVFVAPMFLALY